MPRDPRIDPQPGDRVRVRGNATYYGAELRIVSRIEGAIRYQDTGYSGRTLDTEINEWRSWCRRNKAEVVEEE